MRNIVIEYPSAGEAAFVDLGPPPSPGPRQILIKTDYSGVTNGTERHSLVGEHGWAGAFPSRNGYQHVGTVEAVGPGVAGFADGDRVFYGGYVGHRGWNLIDVSSDAGNHLCIGLPDAVDPTEFALLGVAGVALRGVRRTRVGLGDRVWVPGLGPIGQFAAQAARAAGAEVTVTDPLPDRLAVAKELGAHRAVDPAGALLPDEVRAAGPFTHILDCCGAPNLLYEVAAAGSLAPGGVMGLLAVRSETRFPWGMLHGTQASIEVSCHFGVGDLEALIQLISAGTIGVAPMIRHRVPIQDALGIYQGLRDNPADYLGIVFDWSE